LGVAVALIGRQALAIVTSRAGGISGVKTVTPENRADLRTVDGMSEEDIDRLSEEGVDSIHALASSRRHGSSSVRHIDYSAYAIGKTRRCLLS